MMVPMTMLLDAIEKVLRPGLAKRGPLVLEETSPRSICKPITLHKNGQPSLQALLLQPDRVACPGMSVQDRLFPLFNHHAAGTAVMCDYVVFCQDVCRPEHLFVLHCELKSTHSDGSRQQIENARLLSDYIVEMAKYHHAVHDVPTIERRGLVFRPGVSVPKDNLYKKRCRYAPPYRDGFDDLSFAHYPDGKAYPLSHFCD